MSELSSTTIIAFCFSYSHETFSNNYPLCLTAVYIIIVLHCWIYSTELICSTCWIFEKMSTR